MNILYYLNNAKNYASILKGIPLNEANLALAKWVVRAFYKGKQIRIRFRGKRFHHRDHTVKCEASTFDVYVIN